MLGGVLLFLGGAWALLGLGNIVLSFTNTSIAAGWQAFGLILNMLVFVLPGLVVAGIGELLRRRSPNRSVPHIPAPAAAPTVVPGAGSARPPASEARTAKAIVGVIAVAIVGGVVYAGYSRQPQPTPTATPASTRIDPRLEAAVRQAAVASARATSVRPSESNDRWNASHDQSQMDGTNGVTFSLSAENEIEGWLAQNRPDLVVRCHEHKTDVYVITGMPAQPELGKYETYTVRLRFDAAQPEAQAWDGSTDSKALFSEHPIGLARRIATTRTLLFQFTPFNASQVIVTFDVRGFAPHLAELTRVCGFSQ